MSKNYKPKIVFNSDTNLSERDYLLSAYEITKDGRIYRLFDRKEVKACFDKKGYKRVRLKAPKYSSNADLRKPYKVHRLVAMVYLPDYNDNLQVNHKNGNKSDNRVENLEMVTNSQNAYHAWNHLDSTKRKERLSKALKLFYGEHPHYMEGRTGGVCPIDKYTEDGCFVSHHPSIKDAAKSISDKRSVAEQIGKVSLIGGKYNGFIWRRV